MTFWKFRNFFSKNEADKIIDIDFSQIEDSIDLRGNFGRTLELLEGTSDNYFITGKAGTGKSTLLQCFKEISNKSVVCLAPTGIAAVNIGGQTIHSFFKFPPRPLTEEDIYLSRFRDLYQAIDTLIIDEISMVRADLFDAIDKFLRKNRYQASKPFGGVQIVIFGDIFQLQPVVTTIEEERYFSSYYQSPYFFDSKIYRQLDCRIIELDKVFRQTDIDFINLLDTIRLGNQNHIQLGKINSRYIPGFTSSDQDSTITLTSTNKIASEINKSKLNKIHEREYVFKGLITGRFKGKNLPTEPELRLKKGSQVMFVKNDSGKKWVNGTIGKVHNVGNEFIEVEIIDNDQKFVYSVEQEKWEILKYKFDYQKHKLSTEVIGSFIQYPLKLAWAITIHKSQGLTFDNVVIDMGNGAFAYGQTYVALSRCKKLEGITLKKKISHSDIRVDLPVKRFYESCFQK